MENNIDTFWDNKTEQEKERISEELDTLCQSRKQKTQSNDDDLIRERIEDIRRRWPLGGIKL